MKVKIIGAGSIGNHLAQAARRMGWGVTIVDRDPAALKRTKEEIYPGRYGAWDPEIKLVESKDEPKGGFDIIMIGTPPHVRMPLAIEALKEKPRMLQLEKPLCGPTMEGFEEFYQLYQAQKGTWVVVGYDHAVSHSIEYVSDILKLERIGSVQTIDVEFREHWGGIFKAHPWLSGPQDTYLGYRAKGGGASGEHSHALHLWYHLARLSNLGDFAGTNSGIGRWKECAYALELVGEGNESYDTVASFSFLTDKGKVGRVIQDVVTEPTRKWARVQGTNGFAEWICNGTPEGDLVRWAEKGGRVNEVEFPKKRPDDFYREMDVIRNCLEVEYEVLRGGKDPNSLPISLESGIAVMGVLSAVYRDGKKAGVISLK